MLLHPATGAFVGLMTTTDAALPAAALGPFVQAIRDGVPWPGYTPYCCAWVLGDFIQKGVLAE